MGERDPGIARPGGTARRRPGDPSSGAVLEAGAQVRRDRPPERERPLVFGGGAPFQRAHDAACHGLLQRTDGGRGGLRGLKGQKLEHREATLLQRDRKSTRLNSSHLVISYAVFCLKKKKAGRP